METAKENALCVSSLNNNVLKTIILLIYQTMFIPSQSCDVFPSLTYTSGFMMDYNNYLPLALILAYAGNNITT